MTLHRTRVRRGVAIALSAATLGGALGLWTTEEPARPRRPAPLPLCRATDLPQPPPAFDSGQPDWDSFIGGAALATRPLDFVPLWEDKDGSEFGSVLGLGTRGAGDLFRCTRDGRIRPVARFASATGGASPPPEEELAGILDALDAPAVPRPAPSVRASGESPGLRQSDRNFVLNNP